MKPTSTEFGKIRFSEHPQLGEFAGATSNRNAVRPMPEDKPTKLSRLVKRDTIVGTPEDLERDQKRLNHEIRKNWENKWESRL